MAAPREAQVQDTGTGTSLLEESAVLGMLAGTLVLTLEGALPVEYLNAGDRVVTRKGTSRVTAVEATLVRNAKVVRISHDTLGNGMPCDDVTVAAAQTIVVRDWRAKALCGTHQAVVPASRLTDGAYIEAATLSEARLFSLIFEEPTMIYAGGLELACEGSKVCV